MIAPQIESQEQRRAKDAITQAHRYQQNDPKTFDDYERCARTLPSLLQNLGLAGTLA